MLVTKVTCPRCGKHLKTSRPLAVGYRILCSGCNSSFAVRPEDGARAEEPPAPPPAPRPTPPPALRPTPDAPLAIGAVPTAEEEPRPVSPWLAVLGLGVLVGGVLLLAGGIALAMHLSGKRDRARAEAQAEEAAAPVRPAAPEAEPPALGPVEMPLAPRQNPAPSTPPRAPRRPVDPPPLGPGPGGSAAAPAAPGWLPPAEQKRVNEAIDKGVEHLKRAQRADGTWSQANAVGLAALPGLTLLECGVPRNDPRVELAASYVRSAVPRLDRTYELSLCILFLDRLGEASDRPLIQAMALRLIAGQTPTGGWAYTCPLLDPLEERQLLLALQKTKPASNLDLFVQAPGGRPPPELFVPGSKKTSPDLAVPGQRPGAPGLVGPDAKSGTEQSGTIAFPGELPKPEEKKKPAPKPPQSTMSLDRVHAALPLRLKRVAALTPPRVAGTFPARDPSPTDNSNTQFAILGLWAAGRHEVPTERALALLVKRFRFSQTRAGGWGYQYQPGSGTQTPSMTGAGLLGLAVGHGLVRAGDDAPRGAIQDPAIDRGIQSIARNVGRGLGGDVNLYFLWTLERVGVLYNQRTLAGKDWYAWGARLLVERQGKDGEWFAGGYPGSQPMVDTCLALLFLKRANLTQDLSRKLEFFVEGKAEEPTPPHREQK
jgi:hypothetical protein